MNGVVRVVLSMSFSASLLIVLLVLLRPLWANRLSRRWQYYVWLIAVLRLLLPFTPADSPVGALFQWDAAAEAVQPLADASGLVAADETEGEMHTMTSEPSSIQETGAPRTVTVIAEYAWTVWLASSVLLLVRKVSLCQSYTRCVRAGGRPVGDVRLLEVLAELGAQAGVKRPVELCVSPAASSPMLLGVIRPTVVLPIAELSDEEFRCIVLHELIHFRRRDALCKWLVQLAVCAHWFNPLVYVMEREVGRACELSCDEAVLSMLDVSEYRTYGDTLLHAARPDGAPESCVRLSRSGKLLKERLSAIMRYQKKSKMAAVMAVLLTAVLLAGTVAAGAYSASPIGSAAGKRTQSAAAQAVKDTVYTQGGFYQHPYIFEIGWNLSADGAKLYSGKKITLTSGRTLTVCFADACKKFMNDSAAMKSLAKVLSNIKEDSELPLTRPLVVSVQSVGGKTLKELAAESYEDGSTAALPQFLAVFPFLSEKQQRTYLDKMFSDGRTDFFAASLDLVEDPDEAAARYAGKAYQDGSYSMFSIAVRRLDHEQLESWAVKAQKDRKSGFSSILKTELATRSEVKPEGGNPAYAAKGITYKDGQFFYQGQRVRLLMDLRADGSFERCSCNDGGKADIRIQRDKKGEIVSVSFIPTDEAEAFLADIREGFEEDEWDDDWDWDDWENTDRYDDKDSDICTDISRLELEDLPQSAAKLLKHCGDKSWYLLRAGDRQYIYRKSLTGDYAFSSTRDDDSMQIDLVPMGKKDTGYVLLSVPLGLTVSVSWDGQGVRLITLL